MTPESSVQKFYQLFSCSPDQTYEALTQLSLDRNTVTITAYDSPSTGNPANSSLGIAVDQLFKARLYLVWQWNQVVMGSNGQPVPIFNFLAYDNWQVDFWAKAVNGPPTTGPITTIQVLKGITADPAYTASNVDPGQSALNRNRIYNSQNIWNTA